MSYINIKAFFKFSKVKVINQKVDIQSKVVSIKVEPDKRYTPVCHRCNNPSDSIHSYHERIVRDLNIFDAKTFIQYSYRKIRCSHCGIVIEDLDIVEPGMRVTRRLAQYIIELCRYMTIKEVARHLNLDWKTVKNIILNPMRTGHAEGVEVRLPV